MRLPGPAKGVLYVPKCADEVAERSGHDGEGSRCVIESMMSQPQPIPAASTHRAVATPLRLLARCRQWILVSRKGGRGGGSLRVLSTFRHGEGGLNDRSFFYFGTCDRMCLSNANGKVQCACVRGEGITISVAISTAPTYLKVGTTNGVRLGLRLGVE
ncbi:hypothetical protein BJV78DRAFT_1214902 [Lactifluus subvellereus]|nr:hypothetical protein BJV78DRAFT_1214902 [Lactifluus subvellereus]